MTNKNRYVLNKIRQVAKSSAPDGSSVLLFGSRARGQARKHSDWDILIVLPKEQLQQADYDQVSYPLVELGWTLGEQINPIDFLFIFRFVLFVEYRPYEIIMWAVFEESTVLFLLLCQFRISTETPSFGIFVPPE